MGKEGGTQACEEVEEVEGPLGKGKKEWSQCRRREQITPEEALKRGESPGRDSPGGLRNCLPRQGSWVPPLVWE